MVDRVRVVLNHNPNPNLEPHVDDLHLVGTAQRAAGSLAGAAPFAFPSSDQTSTTTTYRIVLELRRCDRSSFTACTCSPNQAKADRVAEE